MHLIICFLAEDTPPHAYKPIYRAATQANGIEVSARSICKPIALSKLCSCPTWSVKVVTTQCNAFPREAMLVSG